VSYYGSGYFIVNIKQTDNNHLMNFLRKHWYDLGSFFSVVIIICIFKYHNSLTNYQGMMWLSLVSLFFHQLEEYRIVGTFPGMLNTVLYKSEIPDRYPLNTNTALYVNVIVGWTFYFFAALFAEKAIWIGLATILISFGNIIAHTFLFNIKGKTIYNAGLATCWMFFAPCVYFFFSIVYNEHLITTTDYFIGISLGITLNVIGVLKLIDWMANRKTTYIFEDRNLLLKDRKKNSR
jgi:hypothetical protein